MKALKWIVVALLAWPFASLAGEWVNGEVKRVDVANGKVTIKHEELKDLEMPTMTMVFTLKDPEWIKQIKPGQKIRFQAIDLGGGQLQIEAIAPEVE